MRYALVGNPNCGKTTLFNYMTGASARVGNWPGVTVDVKEGTYRTDGSVKIVDMPGIYSTSPYSPEEIVTRNYIINQDPDLVIDVVDVTNLERNLYLTTELLETDAPLIVALNFMDEAERRGYKVDIDGLQKALGVPVVAVAASKGQGIEELMAAARLTAKKGRTADTVLKGTAVYEAVSETVKLIEEKKLCCDSIYTAVKYLEGDRVIKDRLIHMDESSRQRLISFRELAKQASRYGDSEAEIADLRYQFIEKHCSPCVVKPPEVEEQIPSDAIDKVVLNRFVAIPIFLCVIAAVFYLTFGPVGTWLSDMVGGGFDWISDQLGRLILSLGGAETGIAYGLIINGVMTGVSAVLTVLPQILILFLCISLLEGSGYMARAAFIMDRLFRRFGMSGKSFVPLVMGFGCSVPAIMAARTIENEKSRRLTIILTPFMSCGAKIPVYVLLTAVVFGEESGYRMMGIAGVYLLGIIIAMVSGLLLKSTVLKGKTAPFLLELPEYRWPTPRNVLLTLWEKIKDFLTRAGTTITVASIMIWLLNHFSFSLRMVSDADQSILGVVGGGLKYLLIPIGLGTWQLVVTVISGFAGKEMMVATIMALGGTAAVGLDNPASAFSLMAFTLLLPPCVGATTAIAHEMKSAKWSVFTFLLQIAVAWIVSLIVYTLANFIIL